MFSYENGVALNGKNVDFFSLQSGTLYTPPFKYGMCVTVVVNVNRSESLCVLSILLLIQFISMYSYVCIECYISILLPAKVTFISKSRENRSNPFFCG